MGVNLQYWRPSGGVSQNYITEEVKILLKILSMRHSTMEKH